MTPKRFRAAPLLGSLAMLALPLAAQEAAAPKAAPAPYDLTSKSLAELAEIEVSTPGKKPQKLSGVAAAIHVITQEDIRRSGATSIADALRMSPGLDVAQLDSSRWAISSRGFNDFFSNKLLVLIDGRSVYTPLFSGVYWDVQDTMLEDIEQIEVIRGPGAAIWGANAVNGVINIITKSSAATQGGLVSGGAGTQELGFGSIRYGGTLKEGLTYRVYMKYFDRDEFARSPLLGGGAGSDEWSMYRGGFRTDWQISDGNSLRVQGDAYTGSVGQELMMTSPVFPFASNLSNNRGQIGGGNLLSSYQHVFSEDSDLTLQAYYDRTERRNEFHHEIRDTYDLDFRHRFPAGSRQELMWGLGYRLTADEVTDGAAGMKSIIFSPIERNDQLFSAFAQDTITLYPDTVKLVAGAKLEHNSYTGAEFQPNGRLIWEPKTNQSVWFAVSRAVRTPSRFEHNIDAFFTQGGLTGEVVGNRQFDSETLVAYELGYRAQPFTRASFDLALFYNDYDELRAFNLASFGLPPVVTPANSMTGETYGFEVGSNIKATEQWRLFLGYTFLQMQLHDRSPVDLGGAAAEMESPQNQFQIRSYYDLPWNLQLDGSVAWVESLAGRGGAPGYARMDLRLGWSPTRNFDLSIAGQNLLDNHHPEFGSGFLVLAEEIPRSVHVKATWKF